MNGLIRQYFPKGTDFDQVTDEEIAEAVAGRQTRRYSCLIASCSDNHALIACSPSGRLKR